MGIGLFVEPRLELVEVRSRGRDEEGLVEVSRAAAAAAAAAAVRSASLVSRTMSI